MEHTQWMTLMLSAQTIGTGKKDGQSSHTVILRQNWDGANSNDCYHYYWSKTVYSLEETIFGRALCSRMQKKTGKVILLYIEKPVRWKILAKISVSGVESWANQHITKAFGGARGREHWHRSKTSGFCDNRAVLQTCHQSPKTRHKKIIPTIPYTSSYNIKHHSSQVQSPLRPIPTSLFCILIDNIG